MSLKAYDGMMHRGTLKDVTDGFKENMVKFKEASLNKLGKVYADLIVEHIDGEQDMFTQIKFECHNETDILEKLNKIDLDDISLISLLHQSGKILSTGYFVNDFMVHLNVIIEPIENKILIYPNILVSEHREILLTFLTDWYAQDQSDADETVSDGEWNERVSDWQDFNEVCGLTTKIVLFNPDHHWDSLNKHFRGDELYEYVFRNIPSDESRIRAIAYRLLLNEKTNGMDWAAQRSEIINISMDLRKSDNIELEEYIKTHDIVVPTIDKDCLNSKYIPNK